MIAVSDWRLIQPKDWRWLHFLPQSLACKEDNSLTVDESLLDELEKLRLINGGEPLVISSCWRTPSYNAKVSTTGTTGPHTTGLAADILCTNPKVFKLLNLAMGLKFTGIGVNQKGPVGSRFLHVDLIPVGSPLNPRPAVWSY